MDKRTLLIGLDGAAFSILDPLMANGNMPFLKRLVEGGTRATLRSTIPALTPPAWTSLTTGRSPGAHGIFDFFRREGVQSHHIRFLTSQDVGSETVWSFVNNANMRATLLNFPLTFPAPHIDGYVVAGGWMPWRQLRLGCYPPDLYDQLKQLPGFSPRELAMDMSHEEKALEGCQQDEYEDWIRLHIRREEQWFTVAQYLMQHDPTELIAVLFDGVDKLQHLCWRFIDPAYAATLNAPWELRVRDLCLEYFVRLDRLMEQLVELAGPNATTVVASDHGFGPQVRTFFINSWLEQRGYLRWANDQVPQATEGREVGIGNGVHIVRADADHPHGVADHEYEAFRDRLIAELRGVVDGEGEPVVEHVWKHDAIFAGPYAELAPDLTLELYDGGLISILASDTIVKGRPQHTGSHRPEGIFIANGPAIRRDERAADLSILEVAPLLLYSLDAPVPLELEGQHFDAVIEPTYLDAHPVRRGTLSSQAKERAAEEEPVWDEEDEALVLRRLQALGYVE
jgi:predicted AlkP superfamily phosphohydrolase/phosphomutase